MRAGGTGPWTSSAGSLPPGLSLSGDGTISGQPAATFNGNLSVTVTDSLGAASTSSLPIAVTTMPTVVTTRLPDAIVGAPYRASLAASGGTAPYKWDAASSVLPAWLTLSPTGLLTGTPSTSGTFDVEPALKDADGTNVSTALAVTAVPDPGPLAITPTTLPAMTVGVPVTVRLSATGADGAVTWLLKAGQVPAGLTFSSEGVLSGTPLTAGRPRFTVQIGDGTARLAAVAYQPAIALPLQVSTTSLREGTVGTAYPTTPLRTFGGRAPFTWSVSDGALPAGLALDLTGSLSGTPSAGGDSAFTVTVVDADGRVASQALTVTARPPLQLTTDALAGATSGVAYSGQLTATGGNGVYTFRRVSGVMPPGLAIAPNGSITGTPTKVGTYSLTFSVRDSVGRSASASGQIVVASAQSPNRPPRVGRGWL